jgi:peptidoglycan-associated lipoprotein
MSDRILFDTDRFNVDPQDQVILQSQAQWLAQHPNARITIEGHADERGTRDYNLALGERRANAAKNYLASLGVSPSRMTTVSYGKERPEALGSNPSAWAQNRRAVSIVVR